MAHIVGTYVSAHKSIENAPGVALALNKKLKKNTADVIRLVQLTDCHLGKVSGHTLAGMDTDASLAAVLAEAPLQGMDFVLATGDLADRGAPEAYQRLKQFFSPINSPVFYLPGNHDDKAVMSDILSETGELEKIIYVGNWQILLLDSTVRGEVGGFFADEELQFLQQQLNARPELHTLVAFHHPLMPVGCSWLDKQRISNAAQFEAIAKNSPELKAIVCGHVHQVFETTVAGAQFFATPSTCAQFAPDSADFKIDQQHPGWRVIELFPDGSLRTEVGRISQQLDVDLKCGGYE